MKNTRDAGVGDQVLVVGAGFSGLVAAWRLQREGFQVAILEKNAHVGGLLQTKAHELGRIETAANGLLASSLAEELFEDCGVSILLPKKGARRRYLDVAGEVSRWPLTICETVQTIFKIVRIKKHPPASRESLATWAERALGLAMARKLVAPAMLGIFAAPSQTLSAGLVVGRFFDRTRTRNQSGRLRGTISAPNGLGSFLRDLQKTLLARGVTIETEFDALSERGVETLCSHHAAGAKIVLAVPAWEAFAILQQLAARRIVASEDRRLEALQNVSAVPLFSVTCFFSKRPPKTGFGTLFAQTSPEGVSDGILGALQNSEIFEGRAKEGIHSETWILGGAEHGERFRSFSDEDLIERILEKRERRLDAKTRSVFLKAEVTRWTKAVPHYTVELEAAREALHEDQSGIVLFGNYLGDLGLASILESTRRLSQRVRSRS